MKKVVIS